MEEEQPASLGELVCDLQKKRQVLVSTLTVPSGNLSKSTKYEEEFLTITIAPFLVAIVVGCQGAPRSIVFSSGTTVITTTFVDEREGTAIT